MRNQGFTLIEALTATALLSIIAGFTLPLALQVTRYQQGENAALIVAGQLVVARQSAVSRRQPVRVSFTGNLVERARLVDGSWEVDAAVPLPGEVSFRIEEGVPHSGSSAPDGFPADSAVSFNGSDSLVFRPDGSARDSQGEMANGVVHLAWPGLLGSARAVTVLGSTGRVRCWQLVNDERDGWTWR